MKLKTALAAMAISVAGTSALAQGDAQKKELAGKIVALQQSAELDNLSAQLTGQAVAPMLQKWAPRLQTEVPESNRKEIADKLNAELNKYREDAYAIIKEKAEKVGTETLVPAYTERFSEEELKQLVAFFDSPVAKKFQAAQPEVLNTLVQRIVEASRSDVQARTAAFDAAAAKLIAAGSEKNSAPKKK